MRSLTLLVLTLLTVGVGAAVGAETNSAAAKHPFSVHDMLAMDRIGDPQVSPDGKWVAYRVARPTWRPTRAAPTSGSPASTARRPSSLTSDPAGDCNPRWCQNGTIYFLSHPRGSSQIWNIDPTGGEARQITDLPLDVSNLEVVPDLHSFLFTLEVYPGLGIAGTVARDEEKAADPATGMVYDELMFRHWDTWEDGKRSHLFLLERQ